LGARSGGTVLRPFADATSPTNPHTHLQILPSTLVSDGNSLRCGRWGLLAQASLLPAGAGLATALRGSARLRTRAGMLVRQTRRV